MTTQKSLTPNFEEDIFINYDHDDNNPLIASHRGWIDTMHESLATRLTQLMGKTPKIWRDVMMEGNQVLTDTLVLRLEETAFLVSVLSPSYVNSDFCKFELHKFYNRAAKKGGIKINNRSRIFKVMKTPIIGDDPRVDPLEESDLPRELKVLLHDSLGYKFYEIDKLTGRLREYWPEHPDYLTKFLDRLDELAQDITKFIKDEIKRTTENSPEPQPEPDNCVYLAETTPDLSEERDEIKSMLKLSNYRVLPDENLPIDGEGFGSKVRECLKRSILSIHLIGSDFTAIPAGEQNWKYMQLDHELKAEWVRKQHELALERGDGDPAYSRLIWMPDGLKAKEEGYQEFIDYLENDPAAHEGAEILYRTPMEELKTIIKNKLKTCQEVGTGGDAGRRIYLYCDKRDWAAVAPVRDYLEARNYKVLLPYSGESEVITTHKNHLKLCDAVLLFYGASNVSYKLDQVRKKAETWREDRPLLAKGVYISGPETECKRGFSVDDFLVMKDFEGFSPKSLRPFLEQLEGTATAKNKGAST
ncbi:MAG: hypothetical protein M3416_02225 [Acidobacteriota bacterium]|nr:hypothetical protein [Acidobacteriota bacterium]